MGKSYLISTISKIFIELGEMKRGNKSKFNYKYEVKYKMNDQRVYINKSKGKLDCFINDKISSINNINLPNKVICSSFLIDDRLLFKKEESTEYPIYEYQGIRGAKTVTSTKTFIKKVANNISNSSSNPVFMEGFEKLLDSLDLNNEIIFKYEIRNKKIFFSYYNNAEHFKYEIDKIIEQRKHTPFWKTRFDDLVQEGMLDYIVESINNLRYLVCEDGKKKNVVYKFDLKNIENNFICQEYIKGIQY